MRSVTPPRCDGEWHTGYVLALGCSKCGAKWDAAAGQETPPTRAPYAPTPPAPGCDHLSLANDAIRLRLDGWACECGATFPTAPPSTTERVNLPEDAAAQLAGAAIGYDEHSKPFLRLNVLAAALVAARADALREAATIAREASLKMDYPESENSIEEDILALLGPPRCRGCGEVAGCCRCAELGTTPELMSMETEMVECPACHSRWRHES